MNAYIRAVDAAMSHGLATFARRRRTHFVAALVLLPALLPLIVTLVPHRGHEIDIERGIVLTQMIEIFYVTGITPLLALFFAGMLIGEDVESQTVSYILTRPVPRSAWIVGRFFAYVAVAAAIIGIAILTLYICVLPLEHSPATDVSVATLIRYFFVSVLSCFAYGALCAMLSALVRHPVVVGVLLLFVWQRFAMAAPGVTDFLTVQKYTTTLLPEGGHSVAQIVGGTSAQFYRSPIAVEPMTAVIVLLLFGAACLALTGAIVRQREYTTPVAVTE